MMLSERRISTPLRLLYGVLPLTLLAILFSPVSASAHVAYAAPTGWQMTYVNQAKAISLWNRHTRYSLRFQLRESSASIINADNSALALTSGCHDCGAVAIAFQVIFARAQDLTALNAKNAADAVSTSCVRCSTLAETYQIIDVSNTQRWLTWSQRVRLEYVGFELHVLRYQRLSADQTESRVAELANQVIAILQNGNSSAPASYAPLASPASNSAPLFQPASSVQPGIKLFVKISSAPSPAPTS